MRLRFTALILVVALTVSACETTEPLQQPTVTPTPPIRSETLAPPTTATPTPPTTPGISRTQQVLGTPGATPTAPADQTTWPPGLFFTWQGSDTSSSVYELMHVDEAGQPQWVYTYSDRSFGDVTFSPTGEQMAFTQYSGTYDVMVVDLSTGQVEQITDTPELVEAVMLWMDAGLVLGTNSIEVDLGIVWNLAFLTPGGQFTPYADLISHAPDAIPNGEGIIYHRRYDEQGNAVDENVIRRWGGEVEVLDLTAYGLDAGLRLTDAHFSPDGTLMGIAAQRGISQQMVTAVVDLQTGEATFVDRYELTGSLAGVQEAAPRWSPDGERVIVYRPSREQLPAGFYTITAAGLELLVEVDPSWVTSVAFSPDGTQAIIPLEWGVVGLVDLTTGAVTTWETPRMVYTLYWP